MNKAYSLTEDGRLAMRDATVDELKAARDTALKRLAKDPADWALRSCWNCNGAHRHFLENLNDGFLFHCIECGQWYYQGIDITLGEDPHKIRSDHRN